jgi:hypothetical protein
MLQHGSNLKALTFNRAGTCHWQPPENWQSTQVQLPFQQLRSLTKLWATNADLLNLPFAVADPADATGSGSTTSTSSSGGSGNPLSALTSIAELSLQDSSVFSVSGALKYLPALGATLTRLRLEYVFSQVRQQGRKALGRLWLSQPHRLARLLSCANSMLL